MKSSEDFISYIKRPKNAEQIISIEEISEVLNSTAIIMQGPLIQDEDFTYQTVKTYGLIYPGALVIVSTWNTENHELVERLKKLDNCEVVLNNLPLHSGILNVNYQVFSTLCGIERAKKLGKKFVWKTRCDYRFYRKGAVDYMAELLNLFPVDVNVNYQHYRIICGAAYMYRAWWVMDQFSFGYIDDMYNYWNYTLVDKDIKTKDVFEYLESNHVTWNERIRKGLAAETSIVLDYFKRMENEDQSITVYHYWKKLKENFIIISCNDVEYYWGKPGVNLRYNEYYLRHLFIAGDDKNMLNSYMWDFQKWIMLYRGKLPYKEEFEEIGEKNTY